MFTTADLPATFRADPAADPATLRAVRTSGLRLDLQRCEHARLDCPTCLIAAARQLVESTAQPVA